MIEPVIVETPPHFPQSCIDCMGTKGPFVDRHRELPGGFHVYHCAKCIKEGAVRFGLVDGARADELLEADKMLADARREIDFLTELLGAEQAKLLARDARIAELEEAFDKTKARIAQLEKLRQDAAATLVA